MTLLLKNTFQSILLEATGASEISSTEVIQNLWSGYGKISRHTLKGGLYPGVIVKNVCFPNEHKHPRGWNTDFSHVRKIKSYEVEVAWYQQWANACDDSCRIPKYLALEAHDDEILMIMEDLDSAGFPARKTSVNLDEINACLKWLANFHATFLGEQPQGLWETGTYWHLETRPDELEALDDLELKSKAGLIDKKLNDCHYKTFVHGDAKLTNFCFSRDGCNVAAVDFQYVGAGCGMKDVAYFIGSCLYEDEIESMKEQLLGTYFEELQLAVKSHQAQINYPALEKEWRALFPVAWTDFHRFMKGWSPGHWKINSYSERMARNVIKNLNLDK